jgi:hypothetical protein
LAYYNESVYQMFNMKEESINRIKFKIRKENQDEEEEVSKFIEWEWSWYDGSLMIFLEMKWGQEAMKEC